nr:MAG TPA: hypothetical protein [Caudoviricetes sp.]DAL80030.1 MAG TPA: hypothetical protein [Caudoviricetes sp.]
MCVVTFFVSGAGFRGRFVNMYLFNNKSFRLISGI